VWCDLEGGSDIIVSAVSHRKCVSAVQVGVVSGTVVWQWVWMLCSQVGSSRQRVVSRVCVLHIGC
jgi:hypothetical protein